MWVMINTLQKGVPEMQKERIGLRSKIRGIAKAAIALSICLAMPFGAISASATSSELPDLNRKGSLSIRFTSNGEPISNGNKVGIYKVADVIEDGDYKFVLKDEFASIGELPKDLDAENETLSVKMDKIARDNGLTLYKPSQELNANGEVKFTDLEVGLYLVVHTKKTEITLPDKKRVIYTINPFLVSIPQNENGILIYDVSTNPKVAPAKEMIPPPPTPPDVPQTGQLWWPVIALGTAGMVFIMVGLIRKAKTK